MLADWTDRHARVCKLALDAGVDERRVRIVEAQAEELVGVLHGVGAALLAFLADRGVSPALLRQANDEMPHMFRRVIEGSVLAEDAAS